MNNHMNQKGFANLIVIGIVLALFLGVGGYFILVRKPVTPSETQQSITPSGDTTVTPTPPPDTSKSIPSSGDTKITVSKVKLLDAFLGQAISNVDVKIIRDNFVRCEAAPCYQSDVGKKWAGKSDNDGFILIPSELIKLYNHITATGYKLSRDIGHDIEKNENNEWFIELDPDNKVYNKTYKIQEIRLKIIDSQTKKSIPNISVWIINNENCRPPECTDYIFKSTTNALGNIYYPFSISVWATKTSPVTIKDSSRIFIDGYKPGKFPAGAAINKVILEKIK